MKIAYLNTQYPSLSHTFIEREVRELRARGVEIETFSIRPPRPQDVLGEHHARAARETFCLLASRGRLLAAQVAAALGSPIAYARAHAEAQRMSAAGLGARARSVGYACEAAMLARELRRRGISHVHVHMANNGAAVARLATIFDPRLRYSLSIHGSAEFFDAYRLDLKRKCEDAVFVRCISDFCKAQVMIFSDPSRWENFHVVHCGVEVEGMARAGVRAPGPLRIVTVGRLEAIKGYPLLLRALGGLRDEGVAFTLEMVGHGRMRGALERQVSELGLGDRVVLAGAKGQEEMGEVYARADLMVVSSFMEGVPVVLMEAMGHGLLVLSTGVGGVPELVRDGESGFVVRAGSEGALREGIREVARRVDDLQRMRDSAREKVEREFSTRSVGEGMERLFRRYVFGKSGADRAE